MIRHLCHCIAFWLALLGPGFAVAGSLTHADLAKRFPAPLQVGEKAADMPVWPLFKQNGTATELVGYAFESADLAPIPGFAGVPMNLLVAIDPKGNFIDVAVLSQHEPVFLDGLGEGPLLQFVQQYKGKSLKQNLNIDSKLKRERQSDAANAYLDGVAKATASVRILNQSALAAALKVARKKLGFAEGRDPDRIARLRPELVAKMSLDQMIEAGLVLRMRVLNRDVEKMFAGSAGEGLDPDVLAKPDGVFIDLYLAWTTVPSVGRQLLAPASWNKLQGRLDEGDQVMLVMSNGPYSVVADDFVRGSISDRLLLRQDTLPVDMRDLDMEMQLAGTAQAAFEHVAVFRIIAQAGLDPSRPLDFKLPITRKKGIVYPERITRELGLSYRLPERFYVVAEGVDQGWPGIWKSRRGELAVLVAGLLVLGLALLLQRRLTAQARRFAWFRAAFLTFTTVFIGYCAQGQLSIVNLTGAIQALLAGRGLAFFLFDPMTVVLWGFVAISLLLWGRGTFCGWLCPFGALQEATGKLGQALGFRQLRIRPRGDARLKAIKYVLLAAIVVSAVAVPQATDWLVEIEPFKTAITLNFVRHWPFVAYAAGLLVLSMFSYKFFCRYLCPFGASLALLGRVRLLDWIPRRAECGTPCQTCRHRCEYQAIKPGGAIAYDECFQCMECVVIHASDTQCAPLMLEVKRARTIPIVSAAQATGQIS